MTDKKHRQPGAGRKPLSKEPSETVHVRVTPAQVRKFRTLGPTWLREKLDQEEIENEQEE
jgi:hypothetical protein